MAKPKLSEEFAKALEGNPDAKKIVAVLLKDNRPHTPRFVSKKTIAAAVVQMAPWAAPHAVRGDETVLAEERAVDRSAEGMA